MSSQIVALEGKDYSACATCLFSNKNSAYSEITCGTRSREVEDDDMTKEHIHEERKGAKHLL